MIEEKIKLFMEKVMKSEGPIKMPIEIPNAITYEHFKNIEYKLRQLKILSDESLRIAHQGTRIRGNYSQIYI